MKHQTGPIIVLNACRHGKNDWNLDIRYIFLTVFEQKTEELLLWSYSAEDYAMPSL